MVNEPQPQCLTGGIAGPSMAAIAAAERDMTNTESGRRAPDFSLPDVNGEDVSLGNLLQAGQRILLVFLRHLG